MLVGKLAVVCMQIALGDKTSVLENYDYYVVIYAKENLLGSGEGALPLPRNFFSILSLKMATFSALWALAHVARGMAPPPLDPPVCTTLSVFYISIINI